jgi:hypothetical protein
MFIREPRTGRDKNGGVELRGSTVLKGKGNMLQGTHYIIDGILFLLR